MPFLHQSVVGIGTTAPQQALSLGPGLAIGTEMTPPTVGTAVGTTGGTLTPGATYYYKYTFLDTAGGETLPSPEFSVTLTGAQNAVTLSPQGLNNTAGSSQRWYRGTAPGAETIYVGAVANNYNPLTDTGGGSAGFPPTVCTAYSNLLGSSGVGNALFANSAAGLINVNNLNSTGGILCSQRGKFYFDGGTLAMEGVGGRALALRVNSGSGSTALYVTSTGLVGVGIAQGTPLGQLHVKPTAVGTPALYLQNIASQTANALELWDPTGATRIAYLSVSGAFTGTAYNIGSTYLSGAGLNLNLGGSNKFTVSSTAFTCALPFTLSAHLISGGTIPTVAAGTDAASVAVTTGSTDTAGGVSATTTASPTANASLVTVTFATAYSAAPKYVSIQGTNAAAMSAMLYPQTITATGFTVFCNVAPAASSSLAFCYSVIG